MEQFVGFRSLILLKGFMKTWVTFLTLVTTFSAYANSCLPFVGNYQVTTPVCMAGQDGRMKPDPSIKNIQIEYNPKTLELTIFFNAHTSTVTREIYISDAREHEGDIFNTGKRYTATCSGKSILIKRVGMAIIPNLKISHFTLDGDYITLKDMYPDFNHATNCLFRNELSME